jgi:hypothetical protein
LLSKIATALSVKVWPSAATGWSMSGVPTIGATVFPQAPPWPIEFPSTLYTTYRLPSLSLKPEASIAPPLDSGQNRASANAVYGPKIVGDVAAPMQCFEPSGRAAAVAE